MYKVFIADDHAIFRKGIQQVLSETQEFSVGGEAANVLELQEKLRSHKCHVVTLDISMPGRSGLEILKDMRKEFPKIPVLVLSAHPESQYAVRSIRAGASGYLNKECVSDELVLALRKITRGGKYISQKVAEILAVEFEKGLDRALHESLSDREYQVMLMIASAWSSSAMAKELSLSVKTVSTYRTRILEKLHLKTNAEIMHYVITEGLLD